MYTVLTQMGPLQSCDVTDTPSLDTQHWKHEPLGVISHVDLFIQLLRLRNALQLYGSQSWSPATDNPAHVHLGGWWLSGCSHLIGPSFSNVVILLGWFSNGCSGIGVMLHFIPAAPVMNSCTDISSDPHCWTIMIWAHNIHVSIWEGWRL